MPRDEGLTETQLVAQLRDAYLIVLSQVLHDSEAFAVGQRTEVQGEFVHRNPFDT